MKHDPLWVLYIPKMLRFLYQTTMHWHILSHGAHVGDIRLGA